VFDLDPLSRARSEIEPSQTGQHNNRFGGLVSTLPMKKA